MTPTDAEVRDHIVRAERQTEGPSGDVLLPARHTLVFGAEQTPGPLAVLDAAGPLPIPAVGETVGLHEHQVRVLESETTYARDEGGRVWVHVMLTVEPVDD